MIYALMATVELDTKAKQDNLLQGIKDKIAGKALWSNKGNPTTIAGSQSEAGKPLVSAVVRFENKADRDEAVAWLRDKIARIPALSGEVRPHLCGHDEGKACENG